MLKIKESRTTKKISTKILADQLGWDINTITSYENGETKPNFNAILKIADALDVSIDELLGGPSIRKFNSVQFPILDSIPTSIPLDSITDIEDFDETIDEFSSMGQYLAVEINDESMAPIIMPGDVMVIQGDFSVNDGETAIVVIDDTDTYCRKVVRTDDGGINLIPNNPDHTKYKIMHFTYADTRQNRVRIIGKVIELRRSVSF